MWLLPNFNDDYKEEKHGDHREYYAGLRIEWSFRFDESNKLVGDLQSLGAPIIKRHSLNMAKNNIRAYEESLRIIRKENNRLLLHRCRFYMYKLAKEQATVVDCELTEAEIRNIMNNPNYASNEGMSDEE